MLLCLKKIKTILPLTIMEELDLSWTQSIVDELESETCAPCIQIEQIPIYCVFIDGKQKVVSMKKEIVHLEKSEKGNYLCESSLLHMIQKHKKGPHDARYGFDCLEMFGIQMEPSQLRDFLNDPDDFVYKNSYSIPQNIYIGPSVFVFHDYHCGYMYFYEMEKIVEPPPSILKKDTKKKKHTKKVRISDILPSRYGVAANKTKRNHSKES